MTTNYLTNIIRFTELLESSTHQMASEYLGEINIESYPKTMFSSSRLDRLLNNLIGQDIKRLMKLTGCTLDDLISCNEDENKTAAVIKKIKEAYDQNKSPSHILGKIALKIQEKRQPIKDRLEKILMLKEKITSNTKEYHQDIEEYKQKYGEQFFSSSAISRAGSNVMAMRLFAQGNDLPTPPKKAMYAIALLHPITDDYLDQGLVNTGIVNGISQKLENMAVQTTNPYEKLVYDLIEDLFKDYPQKEHPILTQILKQLHGEQIRSLEQKSERIDMEKIIDISLRKGGLSTLAAGYIALGKLTERQFKFFYELGALFQFIDDSADTQEDKQDKVKTIWTSAMLKGNKCDQAFYRTLGLHEHILGRAKSDYALDFTYPDFATTLYEQGFRMLMLRGFFINENEFEEETKNKIKQTLPADYKKIQSLMLYLHPVINGESQDNTKKEKPKIPALIY